jgi:adenosylcobinamide kinase / adenosylcobinamide-phosphate guanylyltransferase
MHFITGGAFHGKAEWVSNYYKISRKDNHWYQLKDRLPVLHGLTETNKVVLEGLEHVVYSMVLQKRKHVRDELRRLLEAWLEWEASDRNNKLVLIGTDIGKGIVPMEKEKRMWRDWNGWFFQDVVERADHVNIIWYGISQLLKGEEQYGETIYENR